MSETYLSRNHSSEGLKEVSQEWERFRQEVLEDPETPFREDVLGDRDKPFEELEREWRYDGGSVKAAVNDHEAFYSINGGGQTREDIIVLSFLGQYLPRAGYSTDSTAEASGTWSF
jgi:hypothetical protein